MQDTLATLCFKQIQEMILNGDLKPGEKLKGEYLKQTLNVGLSPIREALSKLAGTKLVTFKDKIGFRVSEISEAKIYDALQTYAKIECLLLKEAIEHGDDEWEANIMAALYRLAKVEVVNSKIPYRIWVERNSEFHNTLIAACKIKGLIQIRDECLALKEWYTRLAYKNLEDTLITTNHNEHAKIAQLVIARKTESAGTQLYNHIIYDIESLILKLKKDGFIVIN